MSNARQQPESTRGRRRRAIGASNVPEDRTSFVGRDKDLRELKTALGRSRLVTLLGPGGIGKSRLAREFAASVATVFSGGVCLVELAEVGNGEAVTPAVARALGIFEHGEHPLDVQIGSALQPGTLLILDNCEHVIEASAGLAARLLSTNPSVRILATSREPLELSGETTFTVTELPVPDASEDLDLGEYARFPGLQLFVDRVLSRDRTFRVTEENVQLIASVCGGVGGMPLALELTAGQASRVTLTTLAGQIEEQLSFESLQRDVPARHRSMRAALATSYEALPPDAQALWKRLSIFRGGATLPAASDVCAYGTLVGDAFEHALHELMERSIVSLDAATPEGRYRMLEPIRIFGLEQARLDDEEHGVRLVHLQWCSSLIPPDALFTGEQQLRWMHTFQAERANIAAALEYCIAEGEIEAGLELFAATFQYWGLSGWFREERHYAEALLMASKRRSRARTIVLFAAGIAAWYTWEIAEGWYEQAQVAAGSDPRGRGLARFGLGYCALMSQSYDRSIDLLESACELLAESETTVFLAQARYALSQAHALKLDYATARAVVERNLSLAAPDDLWSRGITHTQLGLLDWRTGAFDESERHLVEALRIHAALGYRFGIAATLEYLGWVAVSREEPARAAQLVGYANREFDRIGVSVITGLVRDRDDATDLMRERLGAERYRVLSQAGARMQQDEIANLARRDPTTENEWGAQPLTARELEVAELISKGATNLQISLELLIAYETVKTHVRSILRKLEFESRAQIAAWYGTHAGGSPGQ